MRLADIPREAYRLPRGAPGLYLPGPEPRRWPAQRRAILAATLAAAVLVGSAPPTGDASPGASKLVRAAEGTRARLAVAPQLQSAPRAHKTSRLATVLKRPRPFSAALLAPASADTLPTLVPAPTPEPEPATVRAEVTAAPTAPSSPMAYAPETVPIETPFRLLLGAEADMLPARPHGVSGNGLDHWWSDRPLPADITEKRQVDCLARAVYFEARGEPQLGQMAVAQVVINRVKNPEYPDDVCGVVYQNRNWFKRCQFTFACDRIRDAVRDEKAWSTARRIAESYAAGQAWLPTLGAATHYHARRVSPRWASQMREIKTIDRHVFYITHGGGWT